MIFRPRDLLGAELAQVLGHELGVQQDKAPGDEPGDQMHQGHLGGVGLPAEHAFAEEGAFEGDAV